MAVYNSYHTNLILLHKFNTLPDEFRTQIPPSTLQKIKRDVSDIIGCDSIIDKDIQLLRQIVTNQRFLKAAKALYFVFSTIAGIFRHAENKAELLKQKQSTNPKHV